MSNECLHDWLHDDIIASAQIFRVVKWMAKRATPGADSSHKTTRETGKEFA